jgi:hypothetical protein
VSDDQTRRAWLLRLGEMTVLAGVAGLVPEFATVVTASQAQAAVVLPPGVYDPDPSHLSHLLSGDPTPMIPVGTPTDYVLPRRGPLAPAFLSSVELPVAARLVEIILGGLDPAVRDQVVEWIDRYLQAAAGVRRAARRLDPLHRAVAVAYHSEAYVKRLEDDDPQAVARTGLRELEDRARERGGSSFLAAAPDIQIDLVRAIANAAPGSPARRGYDLLRREAIRGYYTTQAGLRELDYKGNAYYGACPGCNGGTG